MGTEQQKASRAAALFTAWVLALLRHTQPSGTLASAQSRLRAMDLRNIAEVKSFCSPPPCIIFPIKAAAVLVNHEVGTEHEWKDCQVMLNEGGGLIAKMLDVQPET